MNEIRLNLYQKFINLGGKIDSEEAMNGTEEKYNEVIIEELFNDLMFLRDKTPDEYFLTLKTLIIDSFCFLDGFDLFQTLVDVIDIYTARDEVTNEISQESIDNILEKSASKRTPHEILLETLQNSKNIEEFDFLLDENNFLEALKSLITTEICVFHNNLTGENPIEEYHYESLENPENIEILIKFFSETEFQTIYNQMLLNYGVKDNTYLLALMWSMAEYCTIKEYTDTKKISEIYGLYTYFLSLLKDNIDDTFFYRIGRNIYTSLLRKIKTEKTVNEKLTAIIEKLSTPEYNINQLKEDLLPKTGAKETVPELFQVFALHGTCDFYAEMEISTEVKAEIDTLIIPFDQKFNEVYIKLGKTNPLFSTKNNES